MSKHPGFFIPVPPEKHAIGRFQEEFVEFRKTGLEFFLLKLLTHPYLYQDPEVVSFLQNDTWEVIEWE